ncbi:hypothetical protein ACIRBX_15125 [Kitasatospora sp. NPDC096147]|uniref:hypothetical protein n=1 Tax=Kitasatospora sp. NPDC096147 TaxID=3364093 RepID=UPI00380107FD
MSDGGTGRQQQRTPGQEGAFPAFGPPPPAVPADGGWTRPDATEPDWSELARRHEAQQLRRRRLRNGGAVAGAVLLVGGITTTALLIGRGTSPATSDAPSALAAGTVSASAPADAPSDPPGASTVPTPTSGPSPTGSPSPSGSPSATGKPSGSPSAKGSPTAPAPSASPSSAPQSPVAPAPQPPAPPSSAAPLDPLTVISSAATDTAPLDPNALFPSATLSFGGKTWTRLTTAATGTCWNATTGGLGNVLTPQGCQTLLRATYTSGTSAVTIGVAVFPQRANADAVTAAHTGQVQGLVPAGSISYCTSAGCANTHAAVGRYTYYTVSGTTKPGGTAADPAATAAGPDFAAHARARLLARGAR